MEKTFAEVWKDGHRERNEYFVSIFAAIWSLLTAHRLKAKEAGPLPRPITLSTAI